MSVHPSRRAYRANERRHPGRTAIAAIAFRGQLENEVQLDENANAAKLGAKWRETYSARRANEVCAAAKLENAEGMRDTFPGRDSRGRVNPRMPRRYHA